MDKYVTGSVIRTIRESNNMTQEELAQKIYVSGKAVSKWETGQGFPDISLIEPLAKALDVSVIELLSGKPVQNQNRSYNMLKSLIYVCPICGNVIQSTGKAVISCCGITLPPLEPEMPDDEHLIDVEKYENEYYVTLKHQMTKEDYISFIAAVSDNGIQFVKLYPEGNCEARFRISRVKYFYIYCSRHGLFKIKV